MRSLAAHLRLLAAYMRVNWRSALEYRANFVVEILLSVVEIAMYLFYWRVFFAISDGPPGIGFPQLAALVAFNHIIYGIADTLTGNHVWDTGEMIVRGQLDIFLVQPKSAIYQIFFSGAQPARGIQIVTGAILFFWFVDPMPQTILLFLFGVIVGGSVFVSWVVMVQSLVFYLGNVMVVYKLLSIILHFAKKPATIFSVAIRFALYSIIPAAYMGSVQAGLVFNPNPLDFILLLLLALASPFVAAAIFRFGMKRYESGNLIGVRI